MKTRTVTEEEFFSFHEELKERGARIIRCVETSFRGKTYVIWWLES